MPRAGAWDVTKEGLVQPFFRGRLVKTGGALASEVSSSEVKHWALEKVPPSACTVTTPLGAMNRRPLVALHRSTLTKTLVAGRKARSEERRAGKERLGASAPLR